MVVQYFTPEFPAMPAPKNVIVTVTGTPSYFDFLTKLADSLRLSKSAVVRQALIEFCQKYGHELPPKN